MMAPRVVCKVTQSLYAATHTHTLLPVLTLQNKLQTIINKQQTVKPVLPSDDLQYVKSIGEPKKMAD